MSKRQIPSDKQAPQKNIALDKEQLSPSFCPRLICKINLYPEQIIFSQGDRNVVVEIGGRSPAALQKIFLLMDGTKSLRELQQQFFPKNPDTISTIVRDLDKQGLIDDASQLKIDSGIDNILELEELTTKLLAQNNAQNSFWQQVESINSEAAIKVL